MVDLRRNVVELGFFKNKGGVSISISLACFRKILSRGGHMT